MNKLSKKDIDARNTLLAAVADTHEAMNTAIADYNEAAAKLWAETVAPAIEAAQAAIESWEGWREDIVRTLDDTQAGRSEKWANGPAAKAYETWRDIYSNADVDPVEAEPPPPVDTWDCDLAMVRDLPDAPEKEE